MSERKEEIRKEDKKWGWKFGLILLASGIGGGFLGGGVGWLTDWLSEGGEGLPVQPRRPADSVGPL